MDDLENKVQAEIQCAGPAWNCILLRNNSGALEDKTGRVVRFGLGNVSKQHSEKIKSSDLVGFTRLTITQEMVGKTVAVITAIEVKRESWKPDMLDAREVAQNAFIQWIRNVGGIAGFCNSVESFRKLMHEWKPR